MAQTFDELYGHIEGLRDDRAAKEYYNSLSDPAKDLFSKYVKIESGTDEGDPSSFIGIHDLFKGRYPHARYQINQTLENLEESGMRGSRQWDAAMAEAQAITDIIGGGKGYVGPYANLAPAPAQQTPAQTSAQTSVQTPAQQTPAQQTPAQQTPAQTSAQTSVQTPAQQTPAQTSAQTPAPAEPPDFDAFMYQGQGGAAFGNYMDTYNSNGRDKAWFTAEYQNLTPEAKAIYDKYQKLVPLSNGGYTLMFPDGFGFSGDSATSIESRLTYFKDYYVKNNTDANGTFTGNQAVVDEFNKDINAVMAIRQGGRNAHLTNAFTDDQGNIPSASTASTADSSTASTADSSTASTADSSTASTADSSTASTAASAAAQTGNTNMATTTGETLSKTLETQTQTPTLAPGTAVDFAQQAVQPDELITAPTPLGKVDTQFVGASEEGMDVNLPTKPDTQTYTAYTEEGTPEFEAAKGKLSSESIIGDIQGTVSQEAIAQAQTEELDERATIRYQMEDLMSAFQEGKPPPAWAAPAMRNAGAIMASRGLGASSMAAAAITQAAMESGIQIAAQDANKYAAIQITNLNNRQQAALQNAMTFAAMDRANLDARMNAAVNNAKNFLSMDLANLSNQQRLKEIDLQSKYQKMFNDQAAENAARQFNAKSQAQSDQFFAELEVQVDNSNKNRMAAMRQFNADQKNAAVRYYDKLNDSRDQFNSNMEVQISQSNATWRRAVNTANTDRQNEENRINALNLLGIQQSAIDKLWQRYRDEASWLVQQAENRAQRAHQVALYAQDNEFKKQVYEDTSKDAFYSQIGGAVYDTFFTMLAKI